MLARTRVNSPLLAASFLGLLTLCPDAPARERTRLVVTRQAAAAECPDEQALRDAVGARLGYEPFALDAPSLIVVAFRREGAKLLATVQMQDAAGIVKGERTLSSGQGDCDELASTTALTISILLDPRSATARAPIAAQTNHDAQPANGTPVATSPLSGESRSAPRDPVAVSSAAHPSPPLEPTQQPALARSAPREGDASTGALSIVPIALGPIQVFSSGGHAFGVRLGLGAELHLGQGWALRLPLVVAAASGSAHADYAELDLVPSVLYRFRDRAQQGFTPYAGAGLKVGGFGAGRALLGKPLAADSSVAALFGEQSFWDDPSFESTLSIGAEITVGGSWHLTRRFSLDVEVDAAAVPVAGTLIEGIAESALARFSL
jgi:hypothetical protein